MKERNTAASRAWRFAVWVTCGIGLAATMIGCAGAPVPTLPPPPLPFRLAVLDFSVPSEWRNPQTPDKMNKEMKGWWFGARDVWHNPGMGRVGADLFAHELNNLSFIHLISRTDIKYYMSGKRELLRKKLDERRRALEQSPNPNDRAEALLIQNMTEAD